MSQELDTLMVKLSADTSALRGELGKAVNAMARSMQAMEKSTAGVNAAIERSGRAIKNILGAALGAVSLDKILTLRKDAFAAASAIETAAKKTGLGVEAFQEYVAVGRNFGLAQEQMTKGLETFRLRLAEADTGKAEAARMFRALGIATKDASGQMRDTESVLDELAGALSRFDRGSQVVLAEQLFGKDAEEFLLMLREGQGRLAQMRAEARGAGQVMRADLVRSGAEFDAQMKSATEEIGVKLKSAFIEMEPVVQDVLKGIKGIIEELTPVIAALVAAYKEGKTLLGTARFPGAEAALSGAWLARQFPDTAKYLREKYNAAARFLGLPGLDPAPVSPEVTVSARRIPPSAGAAARSGEGRGLGWGDVGPGVAGTGRYGTGGGGEGEIAKKLREAREELDRYRLAAGGAGRAQGEFNHAVLALFRAGATPAQIAEFKAIFDATQVEKGKAALADYAAESERIKELLDAEIAGNRELVAVVQARHEMERNLGRALTAAEREAVATMARYRQSIEDTRERMKAAMGEVASLIDTGSNAMRDALWSVAEGGKDALQSLRDIGRRVVNDLYQMFWQLAVTNPLKNALGLSGGTPLPTIGDLGGTLGSWFNTPLFKFAAGGHPPVGVPSIVGERGPEIFIPSVSGTVVPNRALAAAAAGGEGGGVTYIDAKGADAAAIARLERVVLAQGRAVRRLDGEIDLRAVMAVHDARRRGAFSGAR